MKGVRMKKDFKILEKNIEYIFQKKELLIQALTHSSFANETIGDRMQSNERLEFLGDAVLELVVSDYLYQHYTKDPEGQLTKFRAKIVCEPTLAYMAEKIELGKFLRLGRGEENTGGRERNSILSDAFEALIGAIYLDGGIEKSRNFINLTILKDLDEMDFQTLFVDHKTKLQEIVQSRGAELVEYSIVNECGPDHNKSFTAEVSYQNQVIGTGLGRSKKIAEQNAAYNAMKNIK